MLVGETRPQVFRRVDEVGDARGPMNMKAWFTPNIGGAGRIARGITALLLLAGAYFAWQPMRWLGILLLASAAFVAFEALRGWCVVRACGIRTRM